MASKQRMRAMPDLPTVAESGLPGFEAASFYIVLGPANMPAAVVSRLSAEVIKASELPDMKERLALEGADIVAGNSQQAIAHIESEIARWNKVVKFAGIKAE